MCSVRKIHVFFLILLCIGIRDVASYRKEESSDDSVFEWAKNNPGKLIVGGAVGAGAAIVAAPFAVSALGFTSAGIATKSAAAWMMSFYAGGTPAAGILATFQSIGATGTILGSGIATVATGTAGTVAGVAVAKAATDEKKN